MTHVVDVHCGCFAGNLSSLSGIAGDGCAFDGSFLYYPHNVNQTIYRHDPGLTTEDVLYNSHGDDIHWPTIDASGGVLYWVRNFDTIEAYDLSQGLGGVATTVYAGADDIGAIQFHPIDGFIYAVGGGGGHSYFFKVDPVTGARTNLVSDPTEINYFETAVYELAITPDAVWGVCAMLTSTFDGLFRWDLSNASVSYFDPHIAHELPQGGLVGLADNTIIITWFHNLGESGPNASYIFTMDASFAATVRCNDGEQSLGGILDATAPAWTYAVYSDGTTMWRTPCEPVPPCGCLTYVGRVTPDKSITVPNAPGHREVAAPDPRGTSFWLAGEQTGSSYWPRPLFEEYSLVDLSLIQRIIIHPVGDPTNSPNTIDGVFGSGLADFWGGDGDGGLSFLWSNTTMRRESGGSFTALSTPSTFGGFEEGIDPAHDRIIIIRRTNNVTPYHYTITAITYDGTNTDLGSFTDPQIGVFGGTSYPTMTPDGGVWFTILGKLARWHPDDGYTRPPDIDNILNVGLILPRGDGSIWTSDGVGFYHVTPDHVGGWILESVAKCPKGNLAVINDSLFGTTRIAYDDLGQVIIIVPVVKNSSNTQWDVYLFKDCQQWMIGRVGF